MNRNKIKENHEIQFKKTSTLKDGIKKKLFLNQYNQKKKSMCQSKFNKTWQTKIPETIQVGLKIKNKIL